VQVSLFHQLLSRNQNQVGECAKECTMKAP
jgi:hypothetical protein